MKIGVITESFKQPLKNSLAMAKEMGVSGVQIYAVNGELSLKSKKEERLSFKKTCEKLDLEISALCGDLGGHGFSVSAENPEKIAKSKAIVDLAVDLGVKVITTHIGVIPEDSSSPRYKLMLSACREIGNYAAQEGIVFAIETGPETADVLKNFLDAAECPGLGVNLDPANFVMVTGDDPVKAVYTLQKYIVHTHAKDGIRYKESDPQRVYDAFAEGGFDQLVAETGDLFAELPLGKGEVNWDMYLKALSDIGFKGYLTIERETGDNPSDDIRDAIYFLKNKLK